MIAAAIVIFSVSLRLWGIQFGLPHLYHADEPIVVNHALAYSSGDLNPHFFNIPPLVSYLLFFLYGLIFSAGKIFSVWSSAEHFAASFFRDPSLIYLSGRIAAGVIPGAAAVYGMMSWGKKSGSSPLLALLAGLSLAVCFIHVSDSHYIYADIPLVCLIVFFFRFLFTNDFSFRRTHIFAGIWIGSAAALKYNGVFIFLPYLWMACVSGFRNPFRTLFSVLSAAGISALTFICLNPYAMLDSAFFLDELKEQSSANQGVPFLHHLQYSLAEGISWPFFLLAFFGMCRDVRGEDARRHALIFFLAAYYVVLWKMGQPYGRYVLPLVPGLLFFAADFTAWAVRYGKWWRVAAVALISAGLLFNLYKDIRFNTVMSRPDLRTEAQLWIEKNIPSGSRIALDGTALTPRLSFSCSQLQAKQALATGINRKRAEAKAAACKSAANYELFYMTNETRRSDFLFASPQIKKTADELRVFGIDYVIIVPSLYTSPREIAALTRSYSRIKVWDPYEDEAEAMYDPQIITGGPFTLADLKRRKSNGYRIELYALETAAAR